MARYNAIPLEKMTAVNALGEAAVVELIAQIGFYIGVAVLLVSYDVGMPEGAEPPLAK